MKSTFSRLFSNTAAMLLICIVLLGSGEYLLTAQQLYREKKASLLEDAEAVSKLISTYSGDESTEDLWHFRIFLSFSSEMSETDVLVTDSSGTVLICSNPEKESDYNGTTLPLSVQSTAIEEESFFDTGTAGNFFSSHMYSVCIPYYSNTDDSLPSHFIVAFTDGETVRSQLLETTEYFIIVAFFVLVIAMISTSIVADRQTKPLKELAATARDFGHGAFDARAKVDESSTVEFQELATAFNNMATSLEKSEIQRREFVANVSHELKTPMTTIAGFMDGMLDGTIPPEQHRKYMETVSNEVRRLSRLVRSMLEVSRIQDQGIPEDKKSSFDICETIGRTLLTFEQKINQKHMDVEVQLPENGLAVWAEQDSITQVVYNLIDNAVKFCNEGGNLYLQVESNGQKASVSVANTGPTIDPEELPLVFDRFHKADKSRNSNKDGAGLGLYIVKTIIVTHGEDISVTSRDGVTRFIFTLPVKF